MPWLDATRTNEPAEDSALRVELQDMLGLSQIRHPHFSSTTPTPDAIALAQSLRREATRRSRTASSVKPFFKRPLFMLLAASVPLAFTFTALGAWGVKQKRNADALAAKVQELESRQNRTDAAREGARNRETPPLLQASEPAPTIQPDPSKHIPLKDDTNRGELIKPEEKPSSLNNQNDQYRVNERR